MLRTSIALLAFYALATTPALGEEASSFQPYSAYVAPAAGLRVREAPNADAPILAALWQGARVFVREPGARFVRIDGYGVAGFAFVDEDFLTTEPPAPEEPASVSPDVASGAR